MEPQPSPGERQRPIRNASRPTRYRDTAFDTQFQPVPRRRNYRRIQRRNTTGNYVTNKEEWQRLGRGEKPRHIVLTKNKAATSAVGRQNTTPTAPTVNFHPKQNIRQSPAQLAISQSPKNKRCRYPRSHEERTQTVAPPRPFTDTINLPDPAKTSKVLQKRFRTAALRSSSTPPPRATSNYSSAAMGGVKIDKTVINASSDRYCTTRPTDAAAAVGDQHAAAMPIQKVKVNISTNRNTDTTSVSAPGKIQITNVDCPTTSTHPDASEVLLQ